MRKLHLALSLLAISAAALAGCSDLTHPDEIRIIAEPPQQQQLQVPVAPKGDAAAKPGAADNGSVRRVDGDKAVKAPRPAPAEGKKDPASCGG